VIGGHDWLNVSDYPLQPCHWLLKSVEHKHFSGGAMSSVIAEPDLLAEAAGKLHTINAALRAVNAAAAGPTTGVMPAAGDLVSALTAAQFASHAELYQTVSAHAATVQELLATMLGASAGSYAATEAANAAAVG
jgi:pyridoxal/pyridoxine/pyridoxamine kinase